MELTFLKKPCTEKITAVKWTGLNKQEVTDFCDEAVLIKIESEIGEYFGYSIPTCTGNVIAKPGDYIVKLNRHKQSVFEVWSEEKLNESYFNADDINKACLDVEKETIAEKLRKLNAYITDPSKKAPYKFLNSVEQGFLLSGKEILESYLRTLLTYASYKYDDQNTEIVIPSKSKVESTINLNSGNSFLIKVSSQPGKCIVEFFIRSVGIDSPDSPDLPGPPDLPDLPGDVVPNLYAEGDFCTEKVGDNNVRLPFVVIEGSNEQKCVFTYDASKMNIWGGGNGTLNFKVTKDKQGWEKDWGGKYETPIELLVNNQEWLDLEGRDDINKNPGNVVLKNLVNGTTYTLIAKYDTSTDKVSLKCTDAAADYSISGVTATNYSKNNELITTQNNSDSSYPIDEYISLAKATRYDATIKNLIIDLGDYFNLEDNWYTLFGLDEDYLATKIQNIEETDIKEFSYRYQAPIEPEPEPEPEPDGQDD